MENNTGKSQSLFLFYVHIKVNFNFSIDATAETGRFGRLVNHSRVHPNCTTKVVMLDKVPRLVLIAKFDVDAGTELLYDYGDRSKESLAAHPWLAK